ncbi:hypothetical protein MLD38_029085 [Melastoma candidum]|uniref:Uncharacterized protein n=1 Tax=Melastoma candidum TaxID=119954 RepID=A0ACB9N3T7_9MYRT|nr:hypothetical protein MLD38_029085 [Melastoma candidum]
MILVTIKPPQSDPRRSCLGHSPHSAASSLLIEDKRITGTRFDGTWIHLELQNYGFSQLISDRSMVSEYSEDHESLMEDTLDGGGVACPQLGLRGLRSKLKGVEEVRSFRSGRSKKTTWRPRSSHEGIPAGREEGVESRQESGESPRAVAIPQAIPLHGSVGATFRWCIQRLEQSRRGTRARRKEQ